MGSTSFIGVSPQHWISVEVTSDVAIQQGAAAIQQLQLGKQLPAASLAQTAEALAARINGVRTQQAAEDLLRSLYYHSPSAADQGAVALQLISQLRPEDLNILEDLLEEPDPYNLLEQRLGMHNIRALLDSAATGDGDTKNQALLQVTHDMLLSQGGSGNGGEPPPPPSVATDGPDPDPDNDLIDALQRGDIGRAQRIVAAESDRAATAARLAAKGERLRRTLQGYVTSTDPTIKALATEALRQMGTGQVPPSPVQSRTQSTLSAQERAQLRAMVMSPTSNLASLSSTFNLTPKGLNTQLGNILLSALSGAQGRKL